MKPKAGADSSARKRISFPSGIVLSAPAEWNPDQLNALAAKLHEVAESVKPTGKKGS